MKVPFHRLFKGLGSKVKARGQKRKPAPETRINNTDLKKIIQSVREITLELETLLNDKRYRGYNEEKLALAAMLRTQTRIILNGMRITGEKNETVVETMGKFALRDSQRMGVGQKGRDLEKVRLRNSVREILGRRNDKVFEKRLEALSKDQAARLGKFNAMQK